MTSVTTRAKPRRTIASLQVERRYRNAIRLFLAEELPDFTHPRPVHPANILKQLPCGRELMHPGLQVMAYRNYVPDKYSAEIMDRSRDQLDGTPPDPAVFADLPGGACGEREIRSWRRGKEGVWALRHQTRPGNGGCSSFARTTAPARRWPKGCSVPWAGQNSRHSAPG